MNEASQTNPFYRFIVKGIVQFFEEYLYGVLMPNQYISCRWTAVQLPEGLEDAHHTSVEGILSCHSGETCRIPLLFPVLSFKYCFSMVKCVFYVTQTEDGGDVCSARRVMMLLTHCQLGANQSINQSIVIY